jgi:hypothetical protein
MSRERLGQANVKNRELPNGSNYTTRRLLEEALNNEFNNIHKWLASSNKLTMNVEKNE